MFLSGKIFKSELHKKTASSQILPAFTPNTTFEILVFRASRRGEQRTRTSLIPAGRRPFTLRSALAIAMGRASESLMRPAVGRHHRSSRALTQDASTLWDLLIFEIARPGMFIWRRGCRRDSPASRCSLPPLPQPSLPICRLTFLNSFRRARRGIPFFSSYVSVLQGSPFYHRIVAATTALVVGWSANWEKRDNASERTRPYIPRCIPTSHVAPAASRLHHDTSDSRIRTYSRNSSFIVL